MKSVSATLALIAYTATSYAAIEPVFIKVAGPGVFTDETCPPTGSGWVTNYMVPDGKALVIDYIGRRLRGSYFDHDLAVKAGDNFFLFEWTESSRDCDDNFQPVWGLKLASGWELPGTILVQHWDDEGSPYMKPVDLSYVLFGYLVDSSGLADPGLGIQSRIENPVLQTGHFKMTIATPRPAKAIRVEKSRKLQGDWAPVDDATVQPTADPNKQTVTVPAADPQTFIRATASAPAPE